MQENVIQFCRALRSFDKLTRTAEKLYPEYSQEMEIRLLNIHNHIIWHSYTPENDCAADAILYAFILDIARESGLQPEEIPERYQYLLARCGKERTKM